MKILKLIAAIAVSFLAGAIGGIFTTSAIPTWYAALQKPAFNPPNWLFGPAWTALYILMGIALYLIWTSPGENKKIAYIAFFTQLVLNAIWSVLFFGLHNISLAFIEIVVLWCAIIWMMVLFSKISKITNYLLIPYILWVTFAAILNFSVWQLN